MISLRQSSLQRKFRLQHKIDTQPGFTFQGYQNECLSMCRVFMGDLEKGRS